ncbi:polysaccharide deacetylase family protein [Marinivivus vitaminiproducens]|uniref:polysaccharide deacetylase family protein n=1 Tax=Marinivivus vitaminiproducens TaxID=3035935 RepID=UPI002799084D|nr:polysaccharide deacetylase family protein [Geminicoccaceae bacterium SCSIO 64248]
MPLPTHGRYAYSPITDRPDVAWPDGRRLALYIGLNLEHFAFGEGLGAQLAPGGPEPDVLNYAWRDYGNRVGAWRMLELFDRLDLPCSVLLNAAILTYCPELADAHHRRGDEICGHGRTNSERQSVLSETEEKALIADTTMALRQRYGRAPAGWLGPWIAQSRLTPDLLRESGYRYLLDWCHDDQPTWFRTRSGPILSVPYPQELNDIPAIAVRRADASSFADMIIDQFDEMREQSRNQALVMGVALHPYIVGQPFRLRHLRRAFEHIARHRRDVWLTTAGAIAEYWATHIPPDRGSGHE